MVRVRRLLNRALWRFSARAYRIAGDILLCGACLMLPLTPGIAELEHEIKVLETAKLILQFEALTVAGEEFQKTAQHRLRLVRQEMELRGIAP